MLKQGIILKDLDTHEAFVFIAITHHNKNDSVLRADVRVAHGAV